tara:strand:+ start:623 stop:2251 length:1629 start_codon:yes stop_codon:yes gene_type:complete
MLACDCGNAFECNGAKAPGDVAEVVGRALELIRATPKTSRDYVRVEFAALLVCVGRVDAAQQVAKDVSEPLPRDAFHDMLALRYAATGGIQKSLDVARSGGILADVAGEIAIYQAKQGDVGGARRTVKLAGNEQRRASAKLVIAKYQAEAGDRQSAKALIDSTLSNLGEDVEIEQLNTELTVAYGWAREEAKWNELVEQLLGSYVAIRHEDELRKIAVEAVKAGMVVQGISLATQSLDGYHQTIALEEIFDSLLKKGDERVALDILYGPSADNADWRDQPLHQLARWYLANGRRRDADERICDIEYVPTRIEGLIDLAMARKAAGEPAKAIQCVGEGYSLLDEWDREATRPHALRLAECIAKLARVQISLLHVQEAELQIQRAIGILRNCNYAEEPGVYFDGPFQPIVDAQIELRDFTGARKTLEFARATFEKLALTPWEKRASNDHIAKCYAELGNLDEAIRVANFGGQPGLESAYRLVARWLGSNGRAADAMTWIEKHVPEKMKLFAYASLAQGLLDMRHVPCQLWREDGPSPFLRKRGN